MVWEESIILAPQNVRFAFLSATIPNAREFADWVRSLACAGPGCALGVGRKGLVAACRLPQRARVRRMGEQFI